jgi:hypothetical protein
MIRMKRVVVQQAVSADGKAVAQATSVIVMSNNCSSSDTSSPIDVEQMVNTRVNSNHSSSQSYSQSCV